jgi:Nudix hydrolase domain/NUDIX domain
VLQHVLIAALLQSTEARAVCKLSQQPPAVRPQEWRRRGVRGVWLPLPSALARLVPVAVDAGLQYHHAERSYLMLTAWLPGTPSTLPANASHQVGVGAVVANSRGEMLVVKERLGPAAKAGIWKMPTGLLDAGEDYAAAAAREVREETVHSGRAIQSCVHMFAVEQVLSYAWWMVLLHVPDEVRQSRIWQVQRPA